MTDLAALETKFNKSGICGNPIISDSELQQLYDGYAFIADYMKSTQNSLIASAMLSLRERIRQVQYHRSLQRDGLNLNQETFVTDLSDRIASDIVVDTSPNEPKS